MKSYLINWIFILFCFLSLDLFSQDNLKIKDQNGNVLLEAREEGILVRKMTTAERVAIAGLTTDHNGLMVYDKETKSIWLWKDAGWIELDGIDLVDDADSDPTNELQHWMTLPGIPAAFADGVDNVDDADSDPTNELDTWATLPGIPAGFADGTDNVNDADSDPTNELDTWATLPGIPAGFADGTDNVNDADSDPTNELQTWSTLPGIPVGFSDGTDNVNDADSDPLNEKNIALSRNGTNLEITDAGGTLVANIGWAVDAGKVFNTADNVGIGTNTTPARLTVLNGAVLFDGTTGATPVSGAGTRLMWVPSKQAFRSGAVSSTQWDNANIGPRSFVGGGSDNIATGTNSFTGGGLSNSASNTNSFVGGGFSNTASGLRSFNGGGRDNIVSADDAFVGGGSSNEAMNLHAFVGGGFDNTSSGTDAFVAGGVSNTASGGSSFVGGGLSNIASGFASFASGRESIASGNHSFAAGHGLLAKSFDEIVFGSYNADYTPVSTTGFNNSDRLFVIGNGTNNSNRSNALTVLKGGNVGIGTTHPQAGLHVQDSVGLHAHVMLIENLNHEGSGLKIKIAGSHPMWAQGVGDNPDFFITRPLSVVEVVFEDVAGDIRDYLLSEEGIDLSHINISQIGTPGDLIDQMGLTEFLSGGVCNGLSNLVDFTNSTLLLPIQLPDLPLDGIPMDIPDIPVNLPALSIPNISWDPPNPEIAVGGFSYEIPLGPFVIPTSSMNGSTAIENFNAGITSVNNNTATVNSVLENGYDKVKGGILSLDNLVIPLPQLQMPESIGFIDCPNPNPWDDFVINFEKLDSFLYNITDPLDNDNEFISFVDSYDNKLGSIRAESIGQFNRRYFKPSKVIEIGSYVFGLFSVDGSMPKNALKLVGEVFKYYKENDQMGVEYASGHGDYAEWLERADHTEVLDYGDIVGIRSGKVSLNLDGAEQVMVVSKAPIVLGNIPDPENEINGNNIAFIGQVPVKVMGPVKTGDYIIANPKTPRYGIAVSENEITSEQLAIAVGRSWETNQTPGLKFVNTIVGMHNSGWTAPVTKLQQRIAANEAAIQVLTARLDNLENNSPVAEGNKKSRL